MGFWEPHSSSVDFCEPNYLLSEYIAEPHNVWSSLFITTIGMVGFFYGNPLNEFSVSAMYIILAVIGLGSAGLHTTLHWFYQSSDEVPMLWQILTFLHMLYITNISKNKNSSAPGYAFIGIAVLQTVLYYRFQQIYAVFLASMVVYSTIIIVGTHSLVYTTNKEHRRLRLKVHYWAVFSYLILGVALWVIDMNLCSYLTPLYVRASGFTLHVFWHIFAGIGSYLTATNLTIMRLQEMGHKVDLKFVGFLPVPRIVKTSHD